MLASGVHALARSPPSLAPGWGELHERNQKPSPGGHAENQTCAPPEGARSQPMCRQRNPPEVAAPSIGYISAFKASSQGEASWRVTNSVS